MRTVVRTFYGNVALHGDSELPLPLADVAAIADVLSAAFDRTWRQGGRDPIVVDYQDRLGRPREVVVELASDEG